MDSGSVLHPIGFAPAAISSLVNQATVETHAGEAAFLWTLRARAVPAPHYKLKHLAKLDARVIAHLQGLRTAGAAGWRAAQEQLAQLDPDALRVAAYVAFDRQDPKDMSRVLQL